MNTPDKWVLVELKNLTDNKSHYRVLGSWYGGFAGSNSWKLSSGVLPEKLERTDTFYKSPQESGSTYTMYHGCYGMSGFTSGVARMYEEQSTSELTFKVLTEDQAKEVLDAFLHAN